MPCDLLVFAPHPDDAEIGAGGTIVKAAHAGRVCVVVDMSKGEKSANGTPEIRGAEAQMAAKVMGLAARENLALPDTQVRPTREAVELAVEAIRRWQPAAVLMPHPADYHPDHAGTAAIVKEAWFLAGLAGVGGTYTPWKAPKAYYYFINAVEQAQFYVDITAEFDIKLRAIMCHRSQFDRKAGAVETDLNNGEFLRFLRHRDAMSGAQIQSSYAEGFISLTPLALPGLWG